MLDNIPPNQGSRAEPELGACSLANFFKVGAGARAGKRVTKSRRSCRRSQILSWLWLF